MTITQPFNLKIFKPKVDRDYTNSISDVRYITIDDTKDVYIYALRVRRLLKSIKAFGEVITDSPNVNTFINFVYNCGEEQAAMAYHAVEKDFTSFSTAHRCVVYDGVLYSVDYATASMINNLESVFVADDKDIAPYPEADFWNELKEFLDDYYHEL